MNFIWGFIAGCFLVLIGVAFGGFIEMLFNLLPTHKSRETFDPIKARESRHRFEDTGVDISQELRDYNKS